MPETEQPKNRHYLTALQWWAANWKDYQELYSLMTKALSLRPSSTPAERNWSAFGYIHSLLRNRLTAERVIDLVYVFENLRIQEPATINFEGLEELLAAIQRGEHNGYTQDWVLQ